MQLKPNYRNLIKEGFMTATGGQFQFTEENIVPLRLLRDYFTENYVAFNTYRSPLPNYADVLFFHQKGIRLSGKPGCGKTTILNVFRELVRNTPMAFNILTCRQVSQAFLESKTGIVKSYETKNMLFDDLGTEPILTTPKFGTALPVMKEVIRDRYEYWCRHPNIKTHFTTHLSHSEMIDRYGQENYSRLLQMCNPIVIMDQHGRATDWRQKTIPVAIDNLTFPTIYEKSS